MPPTDKAYVSGYVEIDTHEEFRLIAKDMGKTVSHLVRELVVALTENRLRIISAKPKHVVDLHGSKGGKNE